MKKFSLKLACQTKLDLKALEISKKNFHSASIEDANRMENVLKIHGAQLRCLKILGKNFAAEMHDFDTFLKLVPSLESLELTQFNAKIMKPFSIPQLKTLKIEVDDILQLIKSASKLETLEVNTEFERDVLIYFLGTLTALTSLDIFLKEDLFKNDISLNVQFKLKRFSLKENRYRPVSVNEQHLKTFLELHQETMRHLSLKLALNSTVHHFLSVQFPHLQSIELVVTFLPCEKSFFCCMPKMESVKKMKLHGKFVKHEVAKMFFINFPSLEDLDMSELQSSIWSSKFLKTIATTQKNLQHLSTSSIFKGTHPNLYFKNLNSLHVGSISNSALLVNFILSHPKLEKVSITDKSQTAKLAPEDVEKLMKRLPNLRLIRYNARVENIKTFYDVVSKDFKKLETIIFMVSPKNLGDHESTIKIILPMEAKFRKQSRFDSIIKEMMERHSTRALDLFLDNFNTTTL